MAYICAKKKHATLQPLWNGELCRKTTCSNLEKKSESELTDFDILKSVIGITDIRVIG